jgi:stringent starvation protein B
MRTLAHALIHRRYVEQGETTRIVVLPVPDCGLPQRLVDAAQPVPLDILAGRPTNLVLDDDGVSVDLCFGGPAVRCRFPWEAVMAVQGADTADAGVDVGASAKLLQTLVVTVATVMEDHTIRPASAEHFASLAGAEESPAPGSSPPPEHPHTPRGPRPRLGGAKPRFQVITGKKG